MKLRIAIVAVMVLFAAGLYLYINPIERAKPLFHKSEESVVPDDSDNSDLDESPTPQNKKSPDRVPSVHFHTIVVIFQKRLPTANS